ncbi:MAG TPA: hypothetical protein VHV83_03130, partial [Armatimonadota bacterium]|nr:hypothetical protein [Armatimonadota bacterium]
MTTVTQEARVEFLTCYASWTSEELVVGNTLVERRWKIDEGLLYPSSLFDKVAMMEWLKESSTQPAPCPPIKLSHEQRTLRFSSQTGQVGPTEEPSLRIEGTVQGNTATFRFQLQIFPASTGVAIQLTDYTVFIDSCDSASAATEPADNPTGVELADNSRNDEKAIRCDCLESFRCAAQHTRLIQYTLQDQTDCHNELLFTREWLLHPSESLQLAGCVFVIEDTLHQNGLILLKQ